MLTRPRFKDYVMARLVIMAVVIFLLFTVVLNFIIKDSFTFLLIISLLAFAFFLFIYAVARGAGGMQNELVTINTYLTNLENIEKVDYKTNFFTQEFEDINQNLLKVLQKAKEREDIKQRYNAKLKLKNRQRADMLSAIAHEFRNPIASIMGYSQTLVDDSEIPKPLQDKFLEKIYNNGNKIESLLARLMLWNKFESKETTLHKSKFELDSLAQSVIVSLKDKYPKREITLLSKIYSIEADRTLIEVVLKNLIENALKYSKKDVKVSIKDGLVSVKDRGVGIDPKDIDKVTKKFYRSGTHSWDNSMGLGLSIVKTILSLHGSKLEIESIKDKGSTFSFRI